MDYFLVDSERGEIRTAKPLDREILTNSSGVIHFFVQVRELVDNQPTIEPLTITMAEASVTIKDVSDEPPIFNYKEYHVMIPENIGNGTPLPKLHMTVRDADVVSFFLQILYKFSI